MRGFLTFFFYYSGAFTPNQLLSSMNKISHGDFVKLKKQVNIRPQLKKYTQIMLQAKEQNLNEADMVLRLVKAFEDVFGYDPLQEVSREANMRDKFVGLLLKINGVPKLIIEVKAPGVALRDRQIEQAENYASRNNFHWVLLTNGVEWSLYHLTYSEGIEYEKAFHVDLSADEPAKAADILALLHRDNMAAAGLTGTQVKIGARPKSWSDVIAGGTFSDDPAALTGSKKVLAHQVRHGFEAKVGTVRIIGTAFDGSPIFVELDDRLWSSQGSLVDLTGSALMDVIADPTVRTGGQAVLVGEAVIREEHQNHLEGPARFDLPYMIICELCESPIDGLGYEIRLPRGCAYLCKGCFDAATRGEVSYS